MSPFLSRRPLVGSLRALTSAEMAAPICIAAARTGFLLAALHSVAERVNPRKARPPAPHGPRVLASAAGPHLPLLGEESRGLWGSARTRTPVSCDLFHSRGHARWLGQGERSCGSWRRRRAGRSSGQRGRDRVGWCACPRLTLFATEWSAARRKPVRAAAMHPGAANSADVKARRLPTSDRRKFPSAEIFEARATLREQRESAVGRRSANLQRPRLARRPPRTPPPPQPLQVCPRLLGIEECPHFLFTLLMQSREEQNHLRLCLLRRHEPLF